MICASYPYRLLRLFNRHFGKYTARITMDMEILLCYTFGCYVLRDRIWSVDFCRAHITSTTLPSISFALI